MTTCHGMFSLESRGGGDCDTSPSLVYCRVCVCVNSGGRGARDSATQHPSIASQNVDSISQMWYVLSSFWMLLMIVWCVVSCPPFNRHMMSGGGVSVAPDLVQTPHPVPNERPNAPPRGTTDFVS
jgi:hypothetical protein